MRFSNLAVLVLPLALSVLHAQTQSAKTYFSVPRADAPELAPRGKYPVGVRSVEIIHPQQPDILRFDKQTGKAPLSDRKLTLEIWYPATLPNSAAEQTTYRSAMPGGPERQSSGQNAFFEIAGKAASDAPPVQQQSFPLVIVSHGYPGSRFFLTYLTENLASKGYVVAAIDHTGSVFGDVKPFPSTLLNRSSDQLFSIERIAAMAAGKSFLHGLVDPKNVAIVGYSMGGYGALISAGAGISDSSSLMKFVPGNYLQDLSESSSKFQSIERGSLKAIVAIAPWGNQPPYSAWDAEGLKGIHIPSLFIAGDHDDVADFNSGIKPAFEAALNSERYLLVYENARHNTGGNPPPPGMPLDYGLIQGFDEPVWRKDRITEINQHFITAFLDVYLKGDQSRRAYLDIPVEKSDDGKWKVADGFRDAGAFSTGHDAQGDPFWPGFQRRWALGLEWFSHKAGAKP